MLQITNPGCLLYQLYIKHLLETVKTFSDFVAMFLIIEPLFYS